MSDIQTIVDRVEIDALRGEFTDAAMTNDHERFASLFTADGAVRIPAAGIAAVGHEQLRELGAQRQERLELFIQNTHPGTIRIDGDIADGNAYLCELIRLHDGSSHLNYGIYHDRFRHTADGWKFTERTYEVRYVDTTPLPGSPAPHPSVTRTADIPAAHVVGQ